MAAHNLSEEEVNNYREIRRKGKNRQAAKKSRKKRLDNMDHLKKQRDAVKAQCQELEREWNEGERY